MWSIANGAGGVTMLSWAVRLILIAADFVAGIFVARDALNFEVIQGVVAILLVAMLVFVLAFWPARWTHFINRFGRKA
jgi:hypothetical protein